MIANPETAACAGRPSCAWPEAAAAAAPPTQNTKANAAIASAAARRGSAGRSGIHGLERHADDRQPPRETVERVGAQIVLGHAEQIGGAALAWQLQRIGDMGE